MKNSITWVGIDAHKRTLVIAVFSGDAKTPFIECTIENTERSIVKFARKLKRLVKGGEIRACYEAGTCGFTLQRRLEANGIICEVIAPSLIPRKPGERVKTDRRDARKLAEMFRANVLTAVSPPTPEQEAIRDLCRCREQARIDTNRDKDRLVKFFVRRGHVFDVRKRLWTGVHRKWIDAITFENATDRIVVAEYKLAIEQCERRLKALNEELERAAQLPLYRDHVAWLRCFHGIDTIAAIMIVAELHGVERFSSPRELAAYVGLVPSVHSSGDTRRSGSITKTGNRFIRRILIQAAWHYRSRLASRTRIALRREGQPERVITIADEAERRLNARYNHLKNRGKAHNKVVIAVARELVGFLWAALTEHAHARVRTRTARVKRDRSARHVARNSAQIEGTNASAAPRSRPLHKTLNSRIEVGQRRKGMTGQMPALAQR